MDEFPDNHLLIKTIEDRFVRCQGAYRFAVRNVLLNKIINEENSQENLCIIFSKKADL